MLPFASSNLPADIGRTTLKHLPIWSCTGWGLPCPVMSPPRAVSSYLTFSPLPDHLICNQIRWSGSLFSVALSLPHDRSALPTILFYGVRTFLRAGSAITRFSALNQYRHFFKQNKKSVKLW